MERVGFKLGSVQDSGPNLLMSWGRRGD
jgi:hypothetical protein